MVAIGAFSLPCQSMIVVFWLWGLALSPIFATADDCDDKPGIFFYNTDRCFNSTHVLETSGRCVNGVNSVDFAIFTQCENTKHPDQTGYCHECGPSRLVCSNSKKEKTACAEDNLDGICEDSNTYALYWGCATQQYLFRTSQMCSSEDEHSQDHLQKACGQDYQGFSRCLACPGTQVCVSGDETCESLNLEDGFSHTDVTPKTRPPTQAPTENNNGDVQAVFNATENVLYMPIDPNDVDYNCASFRGDINFYQEECFNETHSVVISGACVGGDLVFGSRAIVPCENAGLGLSYCHKCDEKLVCASSDDSNVVCNNALTDPPPCPVTREAADDSYPMITSTFTGCFNETDFFYNYEFCGQQDTDDSVALVINSQNSPCFANMDGMNFCHSCRDGLQLCAREERSACGIHDYKEELAELEPAVECATITGDIDYYKERCYNSTHTVIWSGECVGGVMFKETAAINTCTDSGEGQTYCHECAHSHLVCSKSILTQEACAGDPTLDQQEAEAGVCDAAKGDRTGSFGGCIDDQVFAYVVSTCVDGELAVSRSVSSCDSAFGGYPFCASCDSIQVCSSEKKQCEELGLHSSARDPSMDFDDNNPVPENSFDDSVACQIVRPNLNYYLEECFNSTHVKMSQGECIDGTKVGRQTAVQSCTEYGEDASRTYCHECSDRVVCSNSYAIDSVCDMTATNEEVVEAESDDDLPSCENSATQLSGAFGCVDEKIFSTMFQTCRRGQFAAERNAFRCSESFPGYSYCNTCGKVNVCAAEPQTSCAGLI